MSSDKQVSQSSAKSYLSADEEFWQNANIDLDALSSIVAAHMQSPCKQRDTMEAGAYARVFLFILENGLRVIVRLILPVREHLKTEAEVSAMIFARTHTSIPVPRVHLYCSNPDNPVGVEWILMEYIPGQQLANCFDDLGYPQKQQTASDIAHIMNSLFYITAQLSGSLSYDKHSEELLSLRFSDLPNHVEHPDAVSFVAPSLLEMGVDQTRHELPASICGPFPSERSFLEAFAYGGMPPQRRIPHEHPHGSAYDVIFKIYDSVRPSYIFDPHRFHFAHGDFSSANILVDVETGHVTGLIDWEMAGFRPSWLAAVSPGWFNDDSCRFLVTDDQTEADGYGEDNAEDVELRDFFQEQLSSRSEEMFQNWVDGVELRTIFYNLCNEYEGNAEVWIEKYAEKQWPEERGSFPFDVWHWMKARLGVEQDGMLYMLQIIHWIVLDTTYRERIWLTVETTINGQNMIWALEVASPFLSQSPLNNINMDAFFKPILKTLVPLLTVKQSIYSNHYFAEQEPDNFSPNIRGRHSTQYPPIVALEKEFQDLLEHSLSNNISPEFKRMKNAMKREINPFEFPSED